MPVTDELIQKITDYETQGYTNEEIVSGLAQSKNYPDIALKIKNYRLQDYSDEDILKGIKQKSAPSGQGTISKAPPYYMREYVKPTLEMGGLTIGGSIPAAVGLAAPPAAAAAIPMAGAGYALGKKAYRALESTLFGTQEPRLEESMGQTIRDIQTGMQYESIGQGVGATATGLIKRLQPYGGRLFDESGKLKAWIADRLKTMQQYGLEPTPADAIPNAAILTKFERLLEYLPGGSEAIVKRHLENIIKLNEARNTIINKFQGNAPKESIEAIGKKIRQEAMQIKNKYVTAKTGKLGAMVDDIINTYGSAEQHEAGSMWQMVYRAAKDKSTKFVRDKYAQIESMLPGLKTEIIPNTARQRVARDLLEEELAIAKPEQSQSVINRMRFHAGVKKGETEVSITTGGKTQPIPKKMIERDPLLQDMIEEASEPEGMTWYGLDKTRSRLLDRNRQIYKQTNGIDTPLTRSNEALITAIDEEMEDYAKSLGDDVWNKYLQARASSRAFHEIYDKKLAGIGEGTPETVISSILKNKDRVTLLRQIQSEMGESGISPLRQGFINDILNKSLKDDILDPKLLHKNLNSIGKETKDILLNRNQQQAFDNIIKQGITLKNNLGKIEGMTTINFLNNLISKDSESTVSFLIRPGNAARVKLAKRLLITRNEQGKIVPSPRLNEIKTKAVDAVLKQSGNITLKESGEYTKNYLPISSFKEFQKYEEPLRELLGSDFDTLKQFVYMGSDMKRMEQLITNASNTAPTIFMGYFGREIQRNPIKSILSIWGQALISKTYLNPTSRNLMLKAWRLPPSSRAAAEYFTKAIGVVMENEQLPEEFNE